MRLDLIGQFNNEVMVSYRNEIYVVRDNGSVLRESRPVGRRRKLDDIWTFGQPCKTTGYMYIAGQRVHHIVATAFHGEKPSEQHVVDHIDTNKRNNRAENLRWLTRLENILKNPITLRRLELYYGSLDEFFKDPSQPKGLKLPQNYAWMRTVSKEEAKVSRERLLKWAASDSQPIGKGLGEWIYASRSNSGPQSPDMTMASLTDGALQRNWRTPTEFPLCPDGSEPNAISRYETLLAPGKVFSQNQFGFSEVVIAELDDNKSLSVITRMGGSGVKSFAVARIFHEGQVIVHESSGSFFSLEGAAKVHCENLCVPWKEHCELSGLPWGDSIDNYC